MTSRVSRDALVNTQTAMTSSTVLLEYYAMVSGSFSERYTTFVDRGSERTYLPRRPGCGYNIVINLIIFISIINIIIVHIDIIIMFIMVRIPKSAFHPIQSETKMCWDD